MSVSFSIDLKDSASAALKAKMAKTSGQRLNAFVGPAVALEVKHNFLSLGHNKQGWPTTNFWAGAARSTNWSSLVDGVVVSCNQIGVRQRYHGGEIKPVNAKFLTIPISPVSYGHVAADFPGLFLMTTKTGAYLVQSGQSVSEKTGSFGGAKKLGGNSKRRKFASLNFLFILKASVTQEADPSVLPTDERITQVALEALQEAVK